MNVGLSRVTRKPVECKTGFGAARRTQIAHRVRRAEWVTFPGGSYLHMEWVCGSESTDAFHVDDPALLGGVCQRCDAIFFGAIVYRCYSAEEQLLYIGSTNRWETREAFHSKHTPWWPEVARVAKSPQPNVGVARQAEIAAIRDEAPLHNKQHNLQRFRRDGHAFVPVNEAA